MPVYRNTSVEQIRLRDYIQMGRLNADGLYPHLVRTEDANQSNEVLDSSKPSSNPSLSSPPPDSSLASASVQNIIPTSTEPASLPPLSPNSHILTSPSTETQQSSEVYSKILKIYEMHNPGKIPNIPSILKKYSGREDILLDKLSKKYAPIDNLSISSLNTINQDQNQSKNDI